MKSVVTYGDKRFVFDHHADGIGDALSSGKFFEEEFLTYVKDNYPNQQVILDIGSNIGNHGVFFSNFLKNDLVFCFEPVTSNMEKLAFNTSGMNIVLFKTALSDTSGPARVFNSQPSNYGGFSLESAQFPNHNPVDCGFDCFKITLDSLHIKNVSMIKIDVENHELSVLNGSKETILRNKPIIFIENLNHGYPNVCPPGKFDSFFASVGYSLKASNIVGGFMDLYIPNNL